MSQVKIIVVAIAVLSVLGTIIGVYSTLKMDIANKKKEIIELKETNADLKSELVAEKLNVAKLKESIYKVNVELDRISVNNKTIEAELEKWQKGHREIVTANERLQKLLDEKLYIDTACQTGLYINSLISELQYEDL